MKASKQIVRNLVAIRHELQRGVEMLKRPGIYVATTEHIKDGVPLRGTAYSIVNKELSIPNNHTTLQPAAIEIIDKQIGSDIVGLYRAMFFLDELLNDIKNHGKKEIENGEQ